MDIDTEIYNWLREHCNEETYQVISETAWHFWILGGKSVITPNRRDKSYEQVAMAAYALARRGCMLIIKHRISEIMGDAQPAPALRAELYEIIKRLNNELFRTLLGTSCEVGDMELYSNNGDSGFNTDNSTI